MDLKELKAFLHLCQSKHFATTAEAMYLSPSTLSRLVQRLEVEIGEPLFIRDNRKVELTQAGVKTREFAASTITEWHNLQQSLKQKSEQLTGSLRIFCTVTAAYEFLPSLIETFSISHPFVDLKITTGDAAKALAEIDSGEADIAIAVLKDGHSSKYFFQSIAEVPLKIIGPNDNSELALLCQNPEVNWNELPIVMPESGPIRYKFEKWLKAMSIKPNIYASVSGHEALVSMAALGCGITIAPQLVIDASPVKSKIFELRPNINPEPFNLGICCQSSKKTAPIVSAFILSANQS
ncbi:HTH-type transcriptional activator IlvY [Psychrosphaera aquimarina]|uniref:HTH-type transcriptional activator IlvY n=1 Tax=Psychrosphaera aquimarina TaxID=2044854 RepID=A0ABU3QY28_9GAMM|nr:HTH-type transcriptional activator IlvY [Psychrosphaera aquimarina]MDU0112312.1 HTH-type transcriptional activator IlvY [Psychrosphaera aquimarina]